MNLNTVISLCLCTIIYVVSVFLVPIIHGATYRAAVVVYTPHLLRTENEDDAIFVKMKNLASFESLTQQAHAQNSDIIVFPEYGLTGVPSKISARWFAEIVPEVIINTFVVPCNNTEFSGSPALQRISCLAYTYNIVIVANLIEYRDGDTFNTNVVFDENGNLIAKYFKQHLFGSLEESIITCPIANNIQDNNEETFTTSFGVEFGTFTCLDILYCNPALSLVRKGVRHFVYPTYWGNRFPYFTSINVRQGWTWRNNVAILSSGIETRIDALGFYSSGSGVYSDGRPLIYHISGRNYAEGDGQVLVSQVPIEPSAASDIHTGDRSNLNGLTMTDSSFLFQGGNSHNNAVMLRTLPRIRTHISVSVEVNPLEVPTDILNGIFSCDIEYEFGQVGENSTFSLAASVYGPTQGSLYYALCTLVKCGTNGCGTILQNVGYRISDTFTYLKITGSFPQGSTVLPTVSGNELELLDPSLFSLDKDSIELWGSEQHIIAMSLWAKVYDKSFDGFCRSRVTDNANNGDETISIGWTFLLYALLFIVRSCNLLMQDCLHLQQKYLD